MKSQPGLIFLPIVKLFGKWRMIMNTAFYRSLAFLLLVSQFAYGQSPLPARIQRVEQGLLPAVLFSGKTGWTIQERLKHYKIPGVSVAVIKDFKVDWARAY